VSSSTGGFRKALAIFVPHRTVPSVPWTGNHRWDLSLNRIFILILGLALFGLGEAFLVQSHIGNSPWVVFSQGISLHTPLSIGASTFVISAAVLLLWIPLGERPGFGTIANMFVIAIFLQIGVTVIPLDHANLALSILMVLLGIAMVGMASAFYITCGLGPGPRDGLMTALHKKTGVRVGRVRLGVELLALSAGIALGGRAGLGTALFALLIGNSVAISFSIVNKFANQ
jgi:uncharacterized membrane protein YczE